MRSHQPETTTRPKARTTVAEPVTRRPTPRRSRTTNALLALQRGHGNRYVQRLLDGRSANPLDERTRSRLERAFGTDLSSVTVERRPEVTAIGALACTRGERIGVAPAQRLDTPAGQALLAHEVTHVVQQRQGRVHPEVRVEGVGFSADERLEAEADAVARRVGSGMPAGLRAPDTPAAGTVAQGKFGFEFETNNSFIAFNGAAIVGEKELAYEDTSTGFRVEGDEGTDAQHFDVEFITDATDDKGRAIRSAAAAAKLASRLSIRATANPDGQTAEGHPVVIAGGPDGTGAWKRRVAIEVEDTTFKGAMQGSVGVDLAQVPGLLLANLGTDEVDRVADMVLNLQAADPNLNRSPALTGFLHIISFYVQRAAMRNERDYAPPRDDHDWVKLPTEHEWQEIVTDGPKANFSVMARTDFHSMFLALSDDDRAAFAMALGDPRHREADSDLATALRRRSLLEPMFTDPYRADPTLVVDAAARQRFGVVDGRENGTNAVVPVVTRSPSILDWLLSIVTGHGYHQGRRHVSDRDRLRKDLLSAPPGWGTVPPGVGFRPNNAQILANAIYAMGAYRMDNDQPKPLAVFELRNLGRNVAYRGRSVAAAAWAQAVTTALTIHLAAGVPAPHGPAPRARSGSF